MSSMAAPSPSRLIVTITEYSTVYPTLTPTDAKLFPTYAPFIPPSAGLSTSPTASPTGISSPTPAPPNPSDHHKPFDIKSLTPLFIAIACIALLLVVLFSYVIWSKCCVGGRFECCKCKVLEDEVGAWKTGQKVRITPGRVRARESIATLVPVTVLDGSSTRGPAHVRTLRPSNISHVGEGVPVAHPSYYADDNGNIQISGPSSQGSRVQVHPYHRSDGNRNNANPYTISRTLSTNFADLDLESGTRRVSPPSNPRPYSNFWTSLKSRYGGNPPPPRPVSPDIELTVLNPTAAPFPTASQYTPSIYSRTTGNPRDSRAFTEHSAPGVPINPTPRTLRTSTSPPQKTYQAYIETDYAPRAKEHEIQLAENDLTSRAYLEAERQMARKSIKSADLQAQLDIVNGVDRKVNRARHPSQYSSSTERLPSPTEFEGF